MIRRVLVLPLNYDHPQTGMVHAFNSVFGERDVSVFDYLAAEKNKLASSVDFLFEHIAQRFKPDWIFAHLQETNVISADVIRRVRQQLPHCVVTHWTGDMRPSVSDYMASICQATHATFASSRGQLPAFIKVGAPEAHYVQIGLDWMEDVMGEPAWEPPFRVPDVVFCGGYYGETFGEGSAERLEVVRAIHEAGIDIGVVGSGWPGDVPTIGVCTVKQQHHVYRRAKVALSINHFNHVDGYYSDRQLISMASGTPVVCRCIPGLGQEFRDREHCMFFRTTQEAVENVTALLAGPDRAVKMGKQGRAEVMRNHSWTTRILNLLPLIEQLQDRLK